MVEEHNHKYDVEVKTIIDSFEMRIMTYLDSLPEEEYCKVPCGRVGKVTVSEKGKRRCYSSMKKGIKVH